MIYSVFNWDSGSYDYYNGSGDKLGNRPKARQVLNKPNAKHGVPVEAVLPVLPAGSARIGSGKQARGRIAILPGQVMSPAGKRGGAMDTASGLGDFGGDLSENPLVDSPWLTLGIWFGAFFVGLKVISYIAGAPKK
jgi:hypothetical protein